MKSIIERRKNHVIFERKNNLTTDIITADQVGYLLYAMIRADVMKYGENEVLILKNLYADNISLYVDYMVDNDDRLIAVVDHKRCKIISK
jgi:hypothetical protein